MPSNLDTLSSGELARYSRHITLPEVGREGQERLRASKVLIVGAGGLGSPAALYLAAAGVGTLGVADFDRVEEHNLQRQILHGTGDVGRSKVDSARARLGDLNPYVRFRFHPEGITPENSVDLISDYDLVLDGSDNFSTRYLNNDSAFFAGKPLVYGSIFRFEGQASFFHPAEGTPCYRCLFPEPPPPEAVPNCSEAGVFGALPGVIGSLQALEAIKALLGIGEPLRGRLLIFDALGMTFRTLKVKKDPDCPLCGRHPRIDGIRADAYSVSCSADRSDRDHPEANGPSGPDTETPMEISVDEARALLEENPERVLLLDVREPYETEICRIEGSKVVPMARLAESLDELPRDRQILVYCHHGLRSLKATRHLRDHGFSGAASIMGGIDAWARECAPSMSRY